MPSVMARIIHDCTLFIAGPAMPVEMVRVACLLKDGHEEVVVTEACSVETQSGPGDFPRADHSAGNYCQ